jgi:hypothetical protein
MTVIGINIGVSFFSASSPARHCAPLRFGMVGLDVLAAQPHDVVVRRLRLEVLREGELLDLRVRRLEDLDRRGHVDLVAALEDLRLVARRHLVRDAIVRDGVTERVDNPHVPNVRLESLARAAATVRPRLPAPRRAC